MATGDKTRLEARLLLMAGKKPEEVAVETGLKLRSVQQLGGWLNSPSGVAWVKEHGGKQTTITEEPPKEEENQPQTPPQSPPQRTPLLVDTSGKGMRAQGISAGSPGDGSKDGLVPVSYDDGSGTQRTMMMPVNALNRGRGTVNITALTLSYYDRANYDYLAEMKRRTADPAQVPAEYPDALPGFIEDCVVGYFEHVLKKKLVWAVVGE